MDNYYDILGVEESATDEEIKKAYRALAKEWHPDKNTDPKANEKFQEINKANQILSNKQKRQEYDIQRKGGPQVHFSSNDRHSNMADIINEMFGRKAQQQHQTVYQLTVSLEEAFSGVTRKVNTTVSDTSTVIIPAGIRNGNRLNVGGKMFSIRVLPNAKYERQNDHLITVVNINSFDAMLGTTINYKHLDGKEYKVIVPSGIEHGYKLRVQGKGMPNPEIVNIIGDLYIICFIETPKNLTAAQKSAILNVYKPTTIDL